MKPVAVILNDKELVRLLTHLGLRAEFPRFRPAAQASLYEHACGPPDGRLMSIAPDTALA